MCCWSKKTFQSFIFGFGMYRVISSSALGYLCHCINVLTAQSFFFFFNPCFKIYLKGVVMLPLSLSLKLNFLRCFFLKQSSTLPQNLTASPAKTSIILPIFFFFTSLLEEFFMKVRSLSHVKGDIHSSPSFLCVFETFAFAFVSFCL